jgi:ABC-type nitrate/sulfonate/bicarbonate transport system ATPase subunit
MSDRVIVLTGRPARLLEDVEIGGARPRAPEDQESGAIIKRIRSMIRGGQ